MFFDIEPVGVVPPHSHCAQWGMVIDGEMKLTIGDETKVYRKGDWYYIPAGIVHSATFLTRVFVIDVFDDPERYKAIKD
jgi:quercetin dioxygenase-like cupin family protein